MPVRRFIVTGLAVVALLCGGCGGNGNTVAADETNDAMYQQAQDLKKQGRYNEALNAFLKEIDRRGENGAPESHLEAGALYLNWSHNPVEAYHHFSKYLELQPTGPRAAIVRGQREAAMREIARFLLAPANGQPVSGDQSDELDRLRREVAELKAENQTLRGASSVPAVPAARSTPMIALPDDNAPAAAAEPDQVTPAPAPPPNDRFTRNLANSAPANAVAAAPTPVRTAPASPPAAAPTRPAASGRTHTVAPGEKSLWGIARRYYPSVNQARVNAIYEANRETMRSPNDLRVGMVLRIP